MKTNLVTEPAIEPLTLQEAKDHIRVDGVVDDSYIEPLIKVAREATERYLGRALITQTWDLFMDRFPWPQTFLEIHTPPLQSVTTVKYIDNDGAQQTLSSSIYTVDTNAEMGTLELAFNQVWPSIRDVSNAVEIRFIAGYGDNAEDVPEGIKQAMQMLIGHLYERREMTIVGVAINQVPNSFHWLLNPYKVTRFAGCRQVG